MWVLPEQGLTPGFPSAFAGEAAALQVVLQAAS